VGKIGKGTAPPCIAYLENGRICGRPAVYLDRQRGGYVCWLHRPLLPDEKAEANRPIKRHRRLGPVSGQTALF
jgi:hypothetical protein